MLTIHKLEDINEIARQFISQIGEKKIFIFKGKMGAGKTTFIKAVCEELGVNQTVNSPTFSIVNEYETNKEEIIYHFDCYRINKIEEAIEIGVEEYLYSGKLCFIEWAENITPLLPDSIITVEITEKENGEREITIE